MIGSRVNIKLCEDNHLDKKSSPLFLPFITNAFSAQACPIGTLDRESSSLTKRMSYSENLKERKSSHENELGFQSYGGNLSPFCLRSGSILKDCKDESKVERINFNRATIPSQIDPPKFEVSDDARSLLECQEVIMKIHRTLSNKSMKRSKTSASDRISYGKSVEDLFQKLKIRQKVKETSEKLSTKGPAKGISRNQACKECRKSSHNLKKMKKDSPKQLMQLQREKWMKSEKYNQSLILNKSVVRKVQKPNFVKALQNASTNVSNTTGGGAKRICYSERQSLDINDVPGAPPCSPDGILFNIIPSLSDLKSQRSVQQKLHMLRERHTKRDRLLLEEAKLKELELELEKKKKLMEVQRQQIYAVNKVLSDSEYGNYLKYRYHVQGVPV